MTTPESGLLDELTRLAQLGQAILGGPLELDRLARLIYEQAGHVVDTATFQLGLFEGDLYRMLIWVLDGVEQTPLSVRLTRDAPGIVGWLRDSRRPLVVNDFQAELEQLPARPRYIAPNPPRSAIFVPVMVGGRVLGALMIQSYKVAAFDQEDLHRLTIIANSAAAALETARLYDRARRRATQLEVLAEVARRVNVLQPLPALYRQVIDLLAERLPEFICRLYTVGRELELVAQTPTGQAESEYVRSLAEEAVERGARVLREAPGAPDPETIFHGEPARAAWPILIDDDVVGVLSVKVPGAALDDGTLALFESLTAQIAFATLEARVYAEQQAESHINLALRQTAEAIAGGAVLSQSLEAAARMLRPLAGVERVAIYEWDRRGQCFRVAQAVGFTVAESEMIEAIAIVPAEIGLSVNIIGTRNNEIILPPALQPAFASKRVLAYALWSRDELQGLMLVSGGSDSPHRRPVLDGVAGQLALALEGAALQAEIAVQGQLEREIALAQRIQASFIPQELPEHDGWEVAAWWKPARLVGGDFYDFIPLRVPDRAAPRWGVVIADVADKGVPASLYMALARTLLRSIAIRRTSPPTTLGRANELIQQDAQTTQFVTAIYGVWQPALGRFDFANAGHPPPVVFRADGRVEFRRGRGPALAVFDQARYPQTEVTLERGDGLVLFTDGLSDSMDPYGHDFGFERIAETIAAHRQTTAIGIIRALRAAIEAHTAGGEDFDDIAVVVLKRN
jgi:serine phosphatase RsbU (regulator of sigma subunit)